MHQYSALHRPSKKFEAYAANSCLGLKHFVALVAAKAPPRAMALRTAMISDALLGSEEAFAVLTPVRHARRGQLAEGRRIRTFAREVHIGVRNEVEPNDPLWEAIGGRLGEDNGSQNGSRLGYQARHALTTFGLVCVLGP